MAKFKKKYEKIECSNEHYFRFDYHGVIRSWKCVVLDKEVVTYEGDRETARIAITNPERAPQVIQVDTEVSIYGETVRFQLENGFPFVRLEDEWVPSDTFDEAKRNAAAKMYRREAAKQITLGIIVLLVELVIWLINKEIGTLWIMTVFGIFFIASGCFTLVRVFNELRAFKEVEANLEASVDRAEVDAIAEVRAQQAENKE